MAAKEWTDYKTFRFRNDLLWTGWEEITSYGQNHFRETNNRLCKVSTPETTHKRNNHLHKILFPVKHHKNQ